MSKRPHGDHGYNGCIDRDRDRDRDSKRRRDDRYEPSRNDARNDRRFDRDDSRPQESNQHNRNRNQEHRRDGGPERTPKQVDAISADNRRLRDEIKALKNENAALKAGVSIDGRARTAEEGSSVPLNYDEAADMIPAPKSAPGHIPPYVKTTVPGELPKLPVVCDVELGSAPFRHTSTNNTNRTIDCDHLTYEKLEYLGDAYLELFASRLIFSHFPRLTASKMSQYRELLVKNETLAAFSRHYGFEKRVDVTEVVAQDTNLKGNKGMEKILADVFEAYIASVVLDSEEGYAVAEKWLHTLWAPKLLEALGTDRRDRNLLITPDGVDPRKVYDGTAKEQLQKRIGQLKGVKLSYEQIGGTVELKGDRIGQNLWTMGLYLTGYGYEHKLLAKGQGSGKKEAGQWAAIEAMYGDAKEIVEQCEIQCKTAKEKQREERAHNGIQDEPVKEDLKS